MKAETVVLVVSGGDKNTTATILGLGYDDKWVGSPGEKMFRLDGCRIELSNWKVSVSAPKGVGQGGDAEIENISLVFRYALEDGTR